MIRQPRSLRLLASAAWLSRPGAVRVCGAWGGGGRGLCSNGVPVQDKPKQLKLFPADPSMYFGEGRGSKMLHLVRHAEGTHNAAARDKKKEFWDTLYNSKELWDAPLTDTGKMQCGLLKERIIEEGVDVDLVVVSPLTRTLQTAQLSFGGTHPKTPFLAQELCRERIAKYTSEGRSDLAPLKRDWPHVDFSLVKDETDQMFAVKEEDAAVRARAMKFLEWVMTREEQRIAVVSHSVFLQQLYMCFTDTLPEEFYKEKQDFAGMRTAMLCYLEE